MDCRQALRGGEEEVKELIKELIKELRS